MRESQDQDRYVPLGALEQYVRQVNQTPPLAEEEETQLLKRCECDQARDRLVAGYQRFVFGMAKRYRRYAKELDLMDLVQEGNVGLLQALAAYDGSVRETSFRTWTFAWIRGMMYHALLREGAIRLPRYKAEAIRQIDAISSELYGELGRQPTVAEIAREMGFTVLDMCELMALQARQVVSLETPVDEDGEVTLGETIEGPAVPVAAREEVPSLEGILDHLSEQQRAVILTRYGIGSGQPRTQAETARLLGMKLSRVQELDRRARVRLRVALEGYPA